MTSPAGEDKKLAAAVETSIDSIFVHIATLEEGLGEKAQSTIGHIPFGKAAEVVTRLVQPSKVRSPR